MAIKFMKTGDSLLVGVYSIYDFEIRRTHAAYDATMNVPVIMTTLQEDGSLYEKTIMLLWDDYNLVKENEVERKKVLNKINSIKAKPTFYFGFTDINTGKPLFISVSEHQGKTLQKGLEKLEKHFKKYPIEIIKGEKGTWSMMLYKEKLTPEQKTNFDSTTNILIEEYESVMFKADYERQVEDIKKFGEHFGFDVNRINI